MKKALLIAALTMASAPAFASKARVNSLGNSPHLSDVQDIFKKPDAVVKHGEWATAEFGGSNTTTTAGQGGFARMSGDAAWGAYLGYQNTSVANSRGLNADFLGAENPLNVLYGSKAGDMNWGLNFYHSSSDKKTTKQKQSAMSLGFGASAGAWDARVLLGLGNTASRDNAGTERKLNGKTSMEIGGGYWMDTMYLFGSYNMGGAKHENGGAAVNDTSATTMQFGVVNSHKQEGTDFFYGAALSMATSEDKGTDVATDDTKTTTNTMPVWFGIEAEAASWLVFRGAVKQNLFLFGSTKTETNGTGEADTIAHNTTVSAGLGMKWGKWAFDGVIQNADTAGGNFGLDGGNFLAEGALTYAF